MYVNDPEKKEYTAMPLEPRSVAYRAPDTVS